MTEKLNIEFVDLSYRVKSIFDVFDWNVKTILNKINGEFRGFELTAIMGPSGCGKTTLLNILSGFVTANISGSIKINGEPRNYDNFRKQSAYIMQEDNIYPILTLQETMRFSMRLKTGSAFALDEQDRKIHEILQSLALDEHYDTLVSKLSGGQRKRLSIALELVNDPFIVFLDEPTTGLDSSSSTQCIKLLKQLAKQGRTIVCTIHTPSALLLKMFDNVYVLAEGHCVYQGSSGKLVPFLSDLGLICPNTHNPADFLMEITCNEHGAHNHRLTAKIKNGACKEFQKLSHDTQIIAVGQSNLRISSSFINQVTQLTLRNMLFNKRDKSFALLRIIVHITLGIFLGIIYYDIGNQAEQIISIFKSVFIVTALIMYTSMFSLAVRFPLDLAILRKENFNRWYSVGAHYVALYLADIPTLIVCTALFTTISYILIGHPMESSRFLYVLMYSVLMSIVAQVYGVFSGVFVGLTLTLLFSSLLMVYQIIYAGGLVFMKDVGSVWHWMFEISFMKHTVDAYVSLILGFDRSQLECGVIYCHFQSPQKFLDFIGMRENLSSVLIALLLIWVIFHIASYGMMRIRLRNWLR